MKFRFKLSVDVKDPDMLYRQDPELTDDQRDALAPFFEFHEYASLELEIEVDPEKREANVVAGKLNQR